MREAAGAGRFGGLFRRNSFLSAFYYCFGSPYLSRGSGKTTLAGLHCLFGLSCCANWIGQRVNSDRSNGTRQESALRRQMKLFCVSPPHSYHRIKRRTCPRHKVTGGEHTKFLQRYMKASGLASFQSQTRDRCNDKTAAGCSTNASRDENRRAN